MERIVSGTTPGRIVRTLLLTLMLGVYAGWSLFDAYRAYPQANVEAVVRTKAGITDLDPSVASDARISRGSCEAVPPGTVRQDVLERLGTPGIDHDGRLYYFGRGGFVTIEMRGNAVRSVGWTDGPVYSPASIGFQKLIGFALLPVALAMLVQLVRVLRTRAVLTEDELTIGRGRRIPLKSITHVNRTRSDCYELTFTHEGRTRTIRLDGYVIAKAARMVDAIRAHNHLPEPKAESTRTSPN